MELNLEEIRKMITSGDEATAKWIYFRCRGFCDEPIEEKDLAHKTIASRKSFAVTSKRDDFDKFYKLVLIDLVNRVARFYEQYNLVPN